MRFPNGSFAETARSRMNEIGDPEWNEVRKSGDPFRYREYIRKNPDGPFTEQAKREMAPLAEQAIAWEKVKDSQDPNVLGNFARNYPAHPSAKEADRRASELMWAKVKESINPSDFDDYTKRFPEGQYLHEAKKGREMAAWYQVRNSGSAAAIDNFIREYPAGIYTKDARELALKIKVFKLIHWHGSENASGWIEVQLGITDDGLQITEVNVRNGNSQPDEKHNATIPCSNLKSVDYKTSRRNNPYGNDFVNHLIEFKRGEGKTITLDLGFESQLSNENAAYVREMIGTINTICKVIPK